MVAEGQREVPSIPMLACEEIENEYDRRRDDDNFINQKFKEDIWKR